MMRPFTCVCLLLAGASGLYLYQEKHRTTLLDRQISQVIHATEAARARTGMMRAEWALLNEPGRLQDLADRFLQLKPMAPSQFVQLADLSSRLPAPQAQPVQPVQPAPDQGGGTDADAQVMASADQATDAAAETAPPAAGRQDAATDMTDEDPASAADMAPAPRHATPPARLARGTPPDDTADAADDSAAPILPVARPHAPKPARAVTGHNNYATADAADAAAARSAAHPAKPAHPPIRLAHRDGRTWHDPSASAMLTHGTPLPLAAPRPYGAAVMSAMARPMQAPVPSHRPVISRVSTSLPSRPLFAPGYVTRAYAAPANGPVVGSALGGGRAALPPPVPLAWAESQ